MKKKIISLILAAVMILTFLPASLYTVFATGSTAADLITWTGEDVDSSTGECPIYTFKSTTSVGTLTIPEGYVARARILAVGGGGAGGKADSSDMKGSGGNGGAVVEDVYILYGGNTLSVSVGAGGIASKTRGDKGGNGGDTTVTCSDSAFATIVAGGGAGGYVEQTSYNNKKALPGFPTVGVKSILDNSSYGTGGSAGTSSHGKNGANSTGNGGGGSGTTSTNAGGGGSGIVKIQILEFGTSLHEHQFIYGINGNALTATCISGCTEGFDSTPLSLSFGEDGYLDRTELAAWKAGGAQKPTVTYYAADAPAYALGYTPYEKGDYVAKASVGTAEIQLTYSVDIAFEGMMANADGFENAIAWTYNNGELHLYGYGAIPKGAFDTYGHRNDVTHIIIDDGITNIPYWTFENANIEKLLSRKSIDNNIRIELKPVNPNSITGDEDTFFMGEMIKAKLYDADGNPLSEEQTKDYAYAWVGISAFGGGINGNKTYRRFIDEDGTRNNLFVVGFDTPDTYVDGKEYTLSPNALYGAVKASQFYSYRKYPFQGIAYARFIVCKVIDGELTVIAQKDFSEGTDEKDPATIKYEYGSAIHNIIRGCKVAMTIGETLSVQQLLGRCGVTHIDCTSTFIGRVKLPADYEDSDNIPIAISEEQKKINEDVTKTYYNITAKGYGTDMTVVYDIDCSGADSKDFGGTGTGSCTFHGKGYYKESVLHISTIDEPVINAGCTEIFVNNPWEGAEYYIGTQKGVLENGKVHFKGLLAATEYFVRMEIPDENGGAPFVYTKTVETVAHDFRYEVSGNKLKAICQVAGCPLYGVPITLTLVDNGGKVGFDPAELEAWKNAGAEIPEITYYKKGEDTPIEGIPNEAGDYIAFAKIDFSTVIQVEKEIKVQDNGFAVDFYGTTVSGTGQTERFWVDGDLVIKYTDPTETGTLNVPAELKAWLLAVGGGGSGGTGVASASGNKGKGGNGGAVTEDNNATLVAGTYTIAVGAGGVVSTTANSNGKVGEASQVSCGDLIITANGGSGGGRSSTGAAGTPTDGTTSEITGSAVTYGKGGDKHPSSGTSVSGADNTGDGGQGGRSNSTAANRNGGAGGSGVVIFRLYGHKYNYAVDATNNAVLTATCGLNICPDGFNETPLKLTLTKDGLNEQELAVWETNGAATPTALYYKKDSATPMVDMPNAPGDYVVKATVGSGDNTATAEVAFTIGATIPETTYTIVIPKEVAVNSKGITAIGKPTVKDVENADGKIITYTAEGTDFTKSDDNSKIVKAAYYTAYTDADNNTPLGTESITVYDGGYIAEESLTALYVFISDEEWEKAENGTYTATVTYHFEAKEE